MSEGVNSKQAWLIWILAAACFFSEYSARVSPSVMVPELMHDFHVNALQLGALTAFFYYAYVGMQMPVGILVDRYGVRCLLSINTFLFGIGCALFAAATTVGMAIVGRFLMGFGASFAFVSALKLATVWFTPTRFGLLAGLTQALGMLGASFGQGPVSFLVSAFGWRQTLSGMSLFFMGMGCVVWCMVRDCPPDEATVRHKKALREKPVLEGFKIVLRNPESWMNAVFVGMLYAPTAVIAELWGVSFLERAFGLSTHMAATGISLIFIGWVVGGPLVGWLSDYIGRRKPILLGSVMGTLLFLLPILYASHLPIPVLFLCLFLYGVANTGVATSYAVASELNPRPVAGTSMAFANMASVLIGASFQPLVGWMLDRQWSGVLDATGIRFYTAHDFRMAFSILPIALLIGCFAALKVRETHCQSLH